MFLHSIKLRNMMSTIRSCDTSTCPKILPHVADNKFLFFNADYCPVGQRGWMTLIEKKVDFKYIEVNCTNPADEVTKLFLEVSPKGTVPAGIHRGKNIHESIPFCKYLDEMFPENPLCPTAPYQRWKAMYLLQEVNNEFVPKLYKVLQDNHPDKRERNKKEFTKVLEFFEKELEHCGGPWFMGEYFTIVDISLLTYFERMQHLLPHYLKWDPMLNYRNLRRWSELGFSRESFKITSANRSEQSITVQPFRCSVRADYLREAFDAGAFDTNRPQERRALLDATVSFFMKDAGKEFSALEKAEFSTDSPTGISAV